MVNKKDYCRLCLIKYDDQYMVQLFAADPPGQQLQQQIDVVLSSLKLSVDDKFSKVICIQCAARTMRAYNFMTFCVDNQKLLLSQNFNESLLLESCEDDPQLLSKYLMEVGGDSDGENGRSLIIIDDDTTTEEGKKDTDEDVDDDIEEDEVYGLNDDDDDDRVEVSAIVECQLNDGEEDGHNTMMMANNIANGAAAAAGNNPYTCTVCFRGFGKKANVLSHFQTQHTNLEVPSDYKYEIKRLKCPLCDEMVECLASHLEYHSGKRPFKCNSCEWSFISKNYLSIHFAKLHKLDKAIDMKPDRFHCKLCAKSNNNVGGGCAWMANDYVDLVQHYRLNHLYEMKSKVETCPICQRETRYLKVHLTKHHKHNTPFKCNLCEKSYTKERFLMVHMNTAHAGVKLNEAVSTASNLMGNIRVNANDCSSNSSNNNSVVCAKCQMHFPNKRLLKLHMKRYHHQGTMQMNNNNNINLINNNNNNDSNLGTPKGVSFKNAVEPTPFEQMMDLTAFFRYD